MSDVEDKKSVIEEKLEKLEGTPFFSLFKPYLDFIGKGKLFNLIYLVMAAVSVLTPFVVIYLAIASHLFDFGAKYVFAFIFVWLVVCFACWIGFLIWWDRRKKITAIGKSEFIAIPLVSDIIQTFGEWLGTITAIIGVGGGLFALIFLGDESAMIFRVLQMEFLGSGAMVMLFGLVYGLFIIIIFRIIAELLRIVAALCNNTKDIADNLKK